MSYFSDNISTITLQAMVIKCAKNQL